MNGGRMVGVPLRRRLMSQTVNALFRLCSSVQGTHCFTNGFRAYRVSVLQQAYQRYGEKLIEQTGFPGGTELFLKAATKDVKTGEVPFVLRYDNRGAGSKIHILSTIQGYLRLLQTTRTTQALSGFSLGLIPVVGLEAAPVNFFAMRPAR